MAEADAAIRPDAERSDPADLTDQADLASIAAAAGLRRVHFVAWRDLDDPEAGGSELHAHKIASRWAAAGLDITFRTSAVPGAPQSATCQSCPCRTYHLAWYRPEEQLLRTTTVEQTWREGSGWQLLSEKRLDGDVGLLGEKVVYVVPYDQGPPPQFKTVHLAGDPSP